MGLDIRLPIGLMFTLIGLLLSGAGLTTSESALKRSLGININLYWGIFLIVFGVFMLVMAKRGAKNPPKS
jgi:intracellular septation protein A